MILNSYFNHLGFHYKMHFCFISLGWIFKRRLGSVILGKVEKDRFMKELV